METRIKDEAKSLDDKLLCLKESNSVISLDHAFECVTGDLAAMFACGENPMLLEEPDFNPEWWVSDDLVYVDEPLLTFTL